MGFLPNLDSEPVAISEGVAVLTHLRSLFHQQLFNTSTKMTHSLHDEKTERVPVLRCIGKGACGTVWAASRDGPAFKREDGSPSRTLINDAEMHQRVLKAFQTFKNQSGREDLTLRVPLYERYIEGTDSEWWRANIKMFPQEIMPCNMIQSLRHNLIRLSISIFFELMSL